VDSRPGVPATTEEDLVYQWNDPRFDPARDARVVIARDGATAGFVGTSDEGGTRGFETAGYVHPGHRARGIGVYLLRFAEWHALSLHDPGIGATVPLMTAASRANNAAAELFASFGYAKCREFLWMEKDLTGEIPFAAPLEDAVVRGFRVGVDEETAHRVGDESFAEHWHFAPIAHEDWLALTVQEEGFDPGLWFVAESGGAMVGVLWGGPLLGAGWIYVVGVLQQARRKGVARALMLESFRAFRDRGFDKVRLNVDAINETGAVALYQALGMTEIERWDVFEKELSLTPA
jgi:mycothiol synthase